MNARIFLKWESVLAGVLVLEFVLFASISPYFLSVDTLSDASFNFTERALVALPLALLIVAGEIDISVGAIMALASVAMGLAAEQGVGTPELDEGVHLLRLLLTDLSYFLRHCRPGLDQALAGFGAPARQHEGMYAEGLGDIVEGGAVVAEAVEDAGGFRQDALPGEIRAWPRAHVAHGRAELTDPSVGGQSCERLVFLLQMPQAAGLGAEGARRGSSARVARSRGRTRRSAPQVLRSPNQPRESHARKKDCP